MGLALERFDAIGIYRAQADFGPAFKNYPLTAEAEYAAFEPKKFTGPAELVQRLLGSSALIPCLVKQVFRASLGRPEQALDQAALQGLEKVFRESQGSHRALLFALVESLTFRYRRDATKGEKL